jgi:hypothetical protein
MEGNAATVAAVVPAFRRLRLEILILLRAIPSPLALIEFPRHTSYSERFMGTFPHALDNYKNTLVYCARFICHRFDLWLPAMHF